MKKLTLYIYLSLMCLFPTVVYSQSLTPERVLWEARPIPVHIQRGNERIIHFPSEIRYWLPDVLQNQVSVIAANGVLYLRALESFPTTRIRVQSLVDQKIILLDVMADDSPSIHQELIVMTTDSVNNQSETFTQNTQQQDWRVRLTRYAAQALYAPERILKGDAGIRRVPIDTEHKVSLIKTGIIEATPIAAWQGGGLTVTAVKLRNLQNHPIYLAFTESPVNHALYFHQYIRGKWLTITLQHQALGALGKDDTTTVYLVSEYSFVESLGVHIETVEPQREL